MVGRSASILFHFFTLRNVRPPGVPRFPRPHLNVGAHSAGCFHKAREERVKQSGVTFPLSTRPTAVAVYLDTEAGFFQKWPLSFQWHKLSTLLLEFNTGFSEEVLVGPALVPWMCWWWCFYWFSWEVLLLTSKMLASFHLPKSTTGVQNVGVCLSLWCSGELFIFSVFSHWRGNWDFFFFSSCHDTSWINRAMERFILSLFHNVEKTW